MTLHFIHLMVNKILRDHEGQKSDHIDPLKEGKKMDISECILKYNDYYRFGVQSIKTFFSY